MIGGVVMVFVAIWIYQSALKAKVSNVVMWTAICAAAFFVVQAVFVNFNIYFIDLLNGTDVSGSNGEYERDLTSVGDRKTQDDIGGFGGGLLSTLFELIPPVMGFLTAAFIRNRFILKEALTIPNLFSGIKEMFLSIKQSFKDSQ
jgi:hypothetical protein